MEYTQYEPEERASALAIWAGRHVVRDLEVGVHRPNTCLVDREHDEVLRLNLPSVGLVCNGKCAASGVAAARGVELRRLLIRARPVGLARIKCVAAVAFDQTTRIRNERGGLYPGADSQ